LKLRNIENLPVLLAETAQEIGQVNKGVIGDDFKLAYLVINSDLTGPGLVLPDNFLLKQDAVIIPNVDCIKSYYMGKNHPYMKKSSVIRFLTLMAKN
jgi:hypothetical protein